MMAMSHEGNAPIPIVTNVVATVKLGCPIDLKALYSCGYKFTAYDEEDFSAVTTLYLPDSNVSGRVFSTGKLTCLGATSNEEARLSARKLARIIQIHGPYPEARFLNFKVFNVIGKWDVRFPIDLARLMNHLGDDNCKYKHDHAQRFSYTMAEPKVTFTIYHNGKINLMGAKKDQHIFEACEKFFPILENFKKQ